MADFDWDAQDDAQSFDWDQQEDVEKPGALTSAVRKGLSGVTGGFLDELVGAGEAAGRVVGVKGIGGQFSDLGLSEEGPTLDFETLKRAYTEARDREREKLAADARYNPGASAVGEIAGMVASPINKIGKGLSLAKQGAAIGGINALGQSEAEDLPGMIRDTGMGTAMGFGVGKAVDVASPLIQKGVEKVSSGARDMAERLAGRALGAERGTIKSLGYDRVKAAGGQALDEGALPILGDTDELIARNTALKKKGGEMMGEAYQAIDDAGASTFNPLEVATKVDDQLAPQFRTPINKGETSQLENTLESILARGDQNIPLKQAQALKEEIKAVAFPGGKKPLDPSPKQQMAMDAYRIINQSIDDAVNKGAEIVDKAGLGEILSHGKEMYGNAKTAEKLLRNKQAREQGNRIFGLTDTITGAGALGYGGTTGDWESAGALMLAKKGLEKYGTKTGAHVLNRISKALMKSPQMADMYSKNPNAFNAIVQKMEGQLSSGIKAAESEAKPYDKNVIMQKAQGTKYANVLQNAAQRGDQALGATHFILQSTDPEYRQALEQDELEP